MAAHLEEQEPLLSRLNRLDHILKRLEDIRTVSVNHSPKSSYASSTHSSGTITSDGQPSWADFSPESLQKHCRPIDEVIMEVQQKGTLIERLVRAEDRILKVCLQLEEEFEGQKMLSIEKKSPKKSLKHFVKSCVGGNVQHKTKGLSSVI